MRLKNKVAIVTGGGAGIGEAIAMRFAQEGARVVVAEITPSRGESTVEAIQKLGGEAVFVQTDVSSEPQVKAMIETSLKRFGHIDILVNNAAVLISYETRLTRLRMRHGIKQSTSTCEAIGCVPSTPLLP